VSLTADNMATAPKPAGFSYSLIANAIVDELSDTYLYVRASKGAVTTKAVPVPRDRQLLAQCITGGKVEDLVRNTVVTVKFDPTGVVRPEILVQSRPEKEHLTGVKISQRAGNKLFVVLADGSSRVFQIDGGPEAWQQAVAGGDANTLVPGAMAEIDYDPSGQDGIVIRVTSKPAPVKDKGCGCSAKGDTLPSAGAIALGIGLLVALRLRRRPTAT
jgi:MYXO-CTERM domain-containing protein